MVEEDLFFSRLEGKTGHYQPLFITLAVFLSF